MKRLIFVLFLFLFLTGCDLFNFNGLLNYYKNEERPSKPILVWPPEDSSYYFISGYGKKFLFMVETDYQPFVKRGKLLKTFYFYSWFPVGDDDYASALLVEVQDTILEVYDCKDVLICSEPLIVRFIFDENKLDSLARENIPKYWHLCNWCSGDDYKRPIRFPTNQIIITDSTSGWLKAEQVKFVVDLLNKMFHNISFVFDRNASKPDIVIKDSNEKYHCYAVSSLGEDVYYPYFEIGEIYLDPQSNACELSFLNNDKLTIAHEIIHSIGWARHPPKEYKNIMAKWQSSWFMSSWDIETIEIIYSQ